MIIRGKAPLRISFAGGGTDVPPYPAMRGGVVLSTTIDKYAYTTLVVRDDDEIRMESLDYDMVAKYRVDQLLYDGKLDLVKAVIRNIGPLPHGVELFTHSDAPPGSGLGSSSTVVVAALGVFDRLLDRRLTRYEMARLAYKIERVDLGINGGLQDQYSAVFGGFNYMEFYGDNVVVNPLRVDEDIMSELEYHLLLCYTGRTRLSARIIEQQQAAYGQESPPVMAALDELKLIATDMKNALLQGRLDDFGALLHAGWENKKKLAQGVTTPEIDELYAIARQYGALGGKILGAGGGGYMLLYVPFNRRHIVAARLEETGGQTVPFGFSPRGQHTWIPSQSRSPVAPTRGPS